MDMNRQSFEELLIIRQIEEFCTENFEHKIVRKVGLFSFKVILFNNNDLNLFQLLYNDIINNFKIYNLSILLLASYDP